MLPKPKRFQYRNRKKRIIKKLKSLDMMETYISSKADMATATKEAELLEIRATRRRLSNRLEELVNF